MINVLIAPDSFKDSIRAIEVAHFLGKGLIETNQNLQITYLPLADGGEGTLEVLEVGLEASKVVMRMVDSLGANFEPYYLKLKSGTALIETAQASGLERIPKDFRNPLIINSYRTGLQIKSAMDDGCDEIKLFVGGTATNDGGTGILNALGFQFLNKQGHIILPNPGSLDQIADIVPPIEGDLPIIQILTDVKNPFYGEGGATYIYGPQKGLNPFDLGRIDLGFQHFANLISEKYGRSIQEIPGSGAGGGIPGGLAGVLGSSISSATEWIFKAIDLEKEILKTDVIITGEGKFDEQSLQGKLVSGIVEKAELRRKPVFLVCGKVDAPNFNFEGRGIRRIETILSKAKSEEDAIRNPSKYLMDIGKELGTYLENEYICH